MSTVSLNILGILAVFLLIGLNAFFVAAEFALVKIRNTRLEQLVHEQRAGALVARQQTQHLDTTIAATQFGITLASLALGWIGEPSLAHLIEPLFTFLGPNAGDIAGTAAIVISFILITSLHIILGELVPKSVALQRTEGTTLFISRPLNLFIFLFRPFIMALNAIGNRVAGLFGLTIDSRGEQGVHSAEELELMVIESREAGILAPQEEVIMRRVFDFGDKTAQMVMTPRLAIIGIDVNATFAEVNEIITTERFTRYPVYDETIDTIIGLLHIKDIIAFTPEQRDAFTVRTTMRPITHVPETMLLETLLPKMRSERSYMVIAFDEYGSTTGLVTIEDIVEELVGEVQDEFDTDENGQGERLSIETLPDGTFSVDGLMALPDFLERFGIAQPQSYYKTVGGFVVGLLDRTPNVGDEVMTEGYSLRVDEVDHLRIARVHVTPLQQARDMQPASSTTGNTTH